MGLWGNQTLLISSHFTELKSTSPSLSAKYALHLFFTTSVLLKGLKFYKASHLLEDSPGLTRQSEMQKWKQNRSLLCSAEIVPWTFGSPEIPAKPELPHHQPLKGWRASPLSWSPWCFAKHLLTSVTAWQLALAPARLSPGKHRLWFGIQALPTIPTSVPAQSTPHQEITGALCFWPPARSRQRPRAGEGGSPGCTP